MKKTLTNTQVQNITEIVKEHLGANLIAIEVPRLFHQELVNSVTHKTAALVTINEQEALVQYLTENYSSEEFPADYALDLAEYLSPKFKTERLYLSILDHKDMTALLVDVNSKLTFEEHLEKIVEKDLENFKDENSEFITTFFKGLNFDEEDEEEVVCNCPECQTDFSKYTQEEIMNVVTIFEVSNIHVSKVKELLENRFYTHNDNEVFTIEACSMEIFVATFYEELEVTKDLDEEDLEYVSSNLNDTIFKVIVYRNNKTDEFACYELETGDNIERLAEDQIKKLLDAKNSLSREDIIADLFNQFS